MVFQSGRIAFCFLLAAAMGMAWFPAAATLDVRSDASAGPSDHSVPAAFEARGRLVDLAAEMQKLHAAKVPPVHEPLWGFAVEGGAVAELSYFVLLRTPVGEALFADKRFQEHVLELQGRRFPGSALLEVTRYRWLRDGKLQDVYYWCETCSIRGHDPHTCACCQAPVELRETPVREAERKR